MAPEALDRSSKELGQRQWAWADVFGKRKIRLRGFSSGGRHLLASTRSSALGEEGRQNNKKGPPPPKKDQGRREGHRR